MLSFGKYLSEGWEAERHMKYLNRCSKNYDHEGNQNLIIHMAFIIMILVLATVMFIGVKFYLSRRCRGGNRPAKYGPYQRNLITLSQTVQCFILFIITEVILAVSLSILESKGVSRYILHHQLNDLATTETSISATLSGPSC